MKTKLKRPDVTNDPDTDKNQQGERRSRRPLRTIMLLSGTSFLAASVLMYFNIDVVARLFGLQDTEALILIGVFAFVGVVNLFHANTWLREKEKL